MGRDTLRQLEDREVRVSQALRDGRTITHLGAYRWLLKVLILQEKRILKLEEEVNNETQSV